MIPLEGKVIVDGEYRGVVVGRRYIARTYLVLMEDGAAWVHESRVEENGQMEL